MEHSNEKKSDAALMQCTCKLRRKSRSFSSRSYTTLRAMIHDHSRLLVALLFFGFPLRTTSFYSVVSPLRFVGKNAEPLVFGSEATVIAERNGLISCRASATSFAFDDTNMALGVSSTIDEIEDWKRYNLDLVRRGNLGAVMESLREMVLLLNNDMDGDARRYLSQCFDNVVQAFTMHAFAPPFGNADSASISKERIFLGTEALQLQMSSSRLSSPYQLIPRKTLHSGLRALIALNGIQRKVSSRGRTGNNTTLLLAFRILQRLITGDGVRTRKKIYVQEKDFNMALNAFAEAGRMDMAHQIVALQERSEHAPPLSPVSFSIMFKGYGRLSNPAQLDAVVKSAERNEVEPDVILLNSLMDAYINCGAIDKAEQIFSQMKNPKIDHAEIKEVLFPGKYCPQPNGRSYNTIIKGLASNGSLSAALELSQEMQSFCLWDSVTTNTLVHAAVLQGEFSLAEDLLKKHTVAPKQNSRQSSKLRQHPNVEAYTRLLDGYGKAGKLEKALSVLQWMRLEGVEPNMITYSCLIGGMGRSKKVDQAMKMIEFMKTTGLKPTVVIYNSLISGLLNECSPPGAYGSMEKPTLDKNVDEALAILREMMQAGVQPNTVTVSVLVNALGKCSEPRVREARALVDKLQREKVIPTDSPKVAAAFINACGIDGDIKGALAAFRQLTKPDLIAVNSFLDACCRCQRINLAKKTFDFYFRKQRKEDRIGAGDAFGPDVISFSVLISAVLKGQTTNCFEEAWTLYQEMIKCQIVPDTTLVDIILKSAVRAARKRILCKKDALLVDQVVKDAENLCWGPGQLERRKLTIRSVLAGQLRQLDEDDELFERYGWNKVNSGFRLLGVGKTEDKPDSFLESKGWNNGTFHSNMFFTFSVIYF